MVQSIKETCSLKEENEDGVFGLQEIYHAKAEKIWIFNGFSNTLQNKRIIETGGPGKDAAWPRNSQYGRDGGTERGLLGKADNGWRAKG